MVQGKLLTAHPGSVHGGGEAPGGQSSLRQGAGKRATGAPDLGRTTAAEQRRDREKGFCLGGFASRRIYRRRGQSGGTRGPGPPGRQDRRPRQVAAWASGGGPLAPHR